MAPPQAISESANGEGKLQMGRIHSSGNYTYVFLPPYVVLCFIFWGGEKGPVAAEGRWCPVKGTVADTPALAFSSDSAEKA